MDDNEIKELSEQLRSVAKIELPQIKNPSILNKGLNAIKDNNIYFKNGNYYSSVNNTFYLEKGETFKGKIKEGEQYILEEGEYKWPSGQIFNGQFGENKYKGNLKLENGYSYKGEFDNINYNGKGKFNWNSEEYIDGNFQNGKIEGEAVLMKKNYILIGNFKNSKVEGKVSKFNFHSKKHFYVFPEFNFENGLFNEELEITRDNKTFLLTNQNLNNITPSESRIEKVISNKELNDLNRCFNLINNIVPTIERPSIPKEGLIVLEEHYPEILFKNDIKAIIDDDDDDHQLFLPNGEKFEGFIKDLDINKYCIYEGTYSWPSGQVYIGRFNENNSLEFDDVDLRFKDEWTYKGIIENGKIKGRGMFEWKNGNKLSAYFLNGKINGTYKIKWDDLLLEGNMTSSSINDFEATIDKHLYKIQKIDKNIGNKRQLLLIEKDESEYFLVIYKIKNNEVIISKNNMINNEEKEILLNILNMEYTFPRIEPFSIGKDGLIVDDRKNNEEINFGNGIKYNKESKTLSLPNNEKFKGELRQDSNNIYWLKEGEYEWPSGQKYIGTFNEKNNFEGNENTKIIFDNKCTYEGEFEKGKPNGKGKIIWENGDNIEGNFDNGKVYGETNIKKNNLNFSGNFINSVIKGSINNINIKIKDHNYKISSITINNGIIQDNVLDIEDEENNKIEVEIKEENKQILPIENYKIFECNENEILLLFKSLSKIRKMQIPYYKSSFLEKEINLPNDSDNKTLKITFSNNEKFKGKIKQIDKNIIYEGEYVWPNGQKYIGTFVNKKFDVGELKYNNEWSYKGEFKKGIIEGNGEYNNYIKGEVIRGIFENGEIKKSVIIKTKDFHFEGDNIDSISELYINIYKKKINNFDYEINDFKMTDDKIKLLKGKLQLEKVISKDLKLKMIESLLIETKSNKQKFYYHEPFNKEESKENKIKMLKIQDNINSQKLSKLSIYYNRLSNENRNIKGEIGKIIGVNLSQEISFNELMHKIKMTEAVNKEDAVRLKSKIEQSKNKDLSKENNFEEIEEKEILRICNNKLLKDMENEIGLIKQDINTLRKERDIIEKEKNEKNKELNDLLFYHEKIIDNYNVLMNQKETIEKDIFIIEQNRKNVEEENNNLVKYLNNIKNNNGKKNNKNCIVHNKIKNLENENHRILKEINEKQEIINSGNKEKEELMKKIKELEEIIEKQKSNK